MFLSPRQLHALIYLSNIFLEESADDCRKASPATSRRDNRSEAGSIADADSTVQYSAMSGGLGLNQGWSSDPAGDLYSNATYGYTQEPTDPPLREFDFESTNSSMSSSVCSSASQSTQTTNRARRRGVIDTDPNADILRLNIRVAFCAIILLQEVGFNWLLEVVRFDLKWMFLWQDILVESSTPTDESPLAEVSVKKLKQISDSYFETVGDIEMEIGATELDQMGQLLARACKNNHLRYVPRRFLPFPVCKCLNHSVIFVVADWF